MSRYVLKRLGLALITLLLLSAIVFATAQLLPGNVGRLTWSSPIMYQDEDRARRNYGGTACQE